MAIYLVSFISSKIYIETNIGEVLDKDYNIFVNNNDNIPTESKTRENCRFISYSLKIRKPFILIRNIQIERVSVDQYINEYTFYNQLDGEVKSLGRYFVSDNKMNFSEGINIFIDELTEDKLIELMKDYIIIVTRKDLINKQHKQFYRIIDYLE
ncbi:MAG: hypothetical protein PHC56_12125 [Herbinix sp.]|nr:hypothetical protein [Herbinix sp.]